jgi:hypothetical protein
MAKHAMNVITATFDPASTASEAKGESGDKTIIEPVFLS